MRVSNSPDSNGALALLLLQNSEGASRMFMYGAMLVFGVAIIAISAKIQVPFWPVPMTLQTFAILAIAAAYGMRMGVTTVLAYLAAGLAGLPVFAGAAAGPAYFVGPTAGFLAGFVIIAAVTGWAADRGWSQKPVSMGLAMLVGVAVCFVLGFAWLGFVFVSAKTGNTLGAEIAFNAGVKPYVLGDLVKIALAASGIFAIDRLTRR